MKLRFLVLVATLFIICVFAGKSDTPTPNDLLRDPFWPVGYKSPERQELVRPEPGTGQTNVQETAWPELKMRGISRSPDGGYVALIEAFGVVRTGEIISIAKENVWYHWYIDGIEAKGLRVTRLGTSSDRNNIPRRDQSIKTTETSP